MCCVSLNLPILYIYVSYHYSQFKTHMSDTKDNNGGDWI